MNATSKTFFKKHLQVLNKEYEQLKKELADHIAEKNITSATLGDKEYYLISIKKWEKYREIKMTEAILKGKEFSYIRYTKPIIIDKINFCKGMLNDLAIRGDSQ